MVERLWAATTERALRLPEAVQRERVGGEWSIVETLRHLVFATDCWLFRAIRLEPSPYHPWGLPWSGLKLRSSPMRLAWTHRIRRASEEVMPVRRHHQQAVRETLENLTDAGLAEVRAAPDSPGHPTGEHSVLQCLHVLLNEEWEHHRYTVRDLNVLDPAVASEFLTARTVSQRFAFLSRCRYPCAGCRSGPAARRTARPERAHSLTFPPSLAERHGVSSGHLAQTRMVTAILLGGGNSAGQPGIAP